MKIVYQAENILDAHLVKGALEHHGIPAYVTGHYLTGGIGELPAHGLVAIIVADDHVPAAQAFLLTIADAPTASDGELDRDWQPEPA
jgi:hypothetical protein